MNGKTIRRQLPSLLLTALFLLTWELLARRMNATYISPSPTQILCRIYGLRKPLPSIHLPTATTAVAASLLLSLLLGIFLMIPMDRSKMVERALYPLLVASQTIPTAALAPLFMLWLGYGIWGKMLAAVLMTFFPTAATLSGDFHAILPEMTELMQTLGVTWWQLFQRLKLPAVLLSFFMTIRMAVPLSVIGAAIGEWLGIQAGLDYFSRHMITQLDNADVLASIVLLSVATMLLTALTRQVETRALRFRNHQGSDREEVRKRDS